MDTIDKITSIRARNNDLWMGVLRIALESNPKDTQALLRVINRNDSEISFLLDKLSKT